MTTETTTKDAPVVRPETKTVTGEPYVYQDFPRVLYKAAPDDPDPKKEKEPLSRVVKDQEEMDEATKEGWSKDVPGATPKPHATAAKTPDKEQPQHRAK